MQTRKTTENKSDAKKSNEIFSALPFPVLKKVYGSFSGDLQAIANVSASNKDFNTFFKTHHLNNEMKYELKEVGRVKSSSRYRLSYGEKYIPLSDGTAVLFSGQDTTMIKIVDRSDVTKCLRELKGHEKEILDGFMIRPFQLLTISNDATMKRWDTQTGECLQTLPYHADNPMLAAELVFQSQNRFVLRSYNHKNFTGSVDVLTLTDEGLNLENLTSIKYVDDSLQFSYTCSKNLLLVCEFMAAPDKMQWGAYDMMSGKKLRELDLCIEMACFLPPEKLGAEPSFRSISSNGKVSLFLQMDDNGESYDVFYELRCSLTNKQEKKPEPAKQLRLT